MKLTHQQIKCLRQMVDGVTAINQYGGIHSLKRSTVSAMYRSGLCAYSNPYNARITEQGRVSLAELDAVPSDALGF